MACLALTGGGDDDARPSGPAIDDETWKYPPLHAAARAGGADAKPFEVRFRVNMSRIASVNTIEGTAYVKVSVVFYWDDARLRDWDQFTPLPPRLWGPYLVFENAEGDVVEAQVEFVLVDQRKTPGRLKRTLRFEGKVLNDMSDLQHFPFDYDTVDLHFWTVSGWKCLDGSLAGHRPHGETYRLSPLPVGGSAEGKFHDLRWDGRISEFILFGYSFQNFRSLPDASNQVKSRFVLSYHVARSARYYFLKVLLPLYLIALYGLSVFFFAPTEFASRMSISSTIFLAAFAVLYVVNEALPKTYFLTKIDVVIVATLSLIFLTAVETVAVSALARRDGERGRAFAERVDVYVGVASLASYVTLNLVVFVPAAWRKRVKAASLVADVNWTEAAEGGSPEIEHAYVSLVSELAAKQARFIRHVSADWPPERGAIAKNV